ncbi:MAG: hypothetical protein GXO80_05765 [Chlorobi bacterium]|nr:hypothetical protein [Chlorobiota bacterium]
MDYQKIKKLTDKYFEGNTSLQEEQELTRFFNEAKNIPPELIYLKSFFQFIKTEQSKTFNKPVLLNQSKHKLLYRLSGIAAVILIAAFIIFSKSKSENKIIYAYVNGKPIYEKRKAEKYSKLALYRISENLNTGTENLNYLNKLNKIEQLIKKGEK